MFKMIHIFHGTDTFESYRKAKSLAEKLAKESKIDLEIINADEIHSPIEILNTLEGVGLFTETRVLMIKRSLGEKQFIDFFKDNWDKINEYQVVLWEDSKVKKNLVVAKNAIKQKTFIEFNLDKPWQLESWVLKIATQKGIKLTKDQANYIVTRVGEDKGFLVSTLQKLHIYLEDKESKTVTQEELAAIVGVSARGDIWVFLEGISTKNTKKAKEEYLKLQEYGTNTQYLIAMIERELDLLSKMVFIQSSGDSESALNLRPFALKNLRNNARNFNMEDIKFLAKTLLDVDYKFKAGIIKEEIVIPLFLRMFDEYKK